MASIFNYAVAHAARFRRGRVSNALEWRSNDDRLEYCGLALLRRDGEGQFSIRWPGDLMPVKGSITTRGMLNALIHGLGLSSDYRIALNRDDHARFLVQINGKWRNQHMQTGEWMPLVEGDLARLAVYAERRVARQEIIKRDVDRLAWLSVKRGNKHA